MPIAKFQMPDGRVARFEVPDGTTPERAQQLMQGFLAKNPQPEQQAPQQQEAPQQQVEQKEIRGPEDLVNQNPELSAIRDKRLQELISAGVPEKIAKQTALQAALGAGQGASNLGTLEAAASIGSGIIAEPIAGIAGLAATPFVGGEKGGQIVKDVRDALTFEPRTEQGKEQLQDVGEALQPVGEAFEKSGDVLADKTLELTDSPALAAAAKTLPTAITELLGGGAALRATGTTLKRSKGNIAKPSEKQINKAIVESAPQIDQLKDTARAVYKEIDDIGVTIKPGSYKGFIEKIKSGAGKRAVNEKLAPKSSGFIDELNSELDNLQGKTLSDIDELRQIASRATKSVEVGGADELFLGRMIDEIDDFLDKDPSTAFKGEANKAQGVGKKYKAARNLWGRAKRAEMIDEALERAARRGSGFENGIRVELEKIVGNKKRSRFFTKDELDSMKQVIKGSNEQNILKMVGRLGFSEGRATNMLSATLGLDVFGKAAPIIGQISKGFSQRATLKGANISDSIVRAGSDGKKIVEAYLKSTPKNKRNRQDLSDLLMNSDNADELLSSTNKFVKEAAEITKGQKAFLTGVAPSAALNQQEQDNGQTN